MYLIIIGKIVLFIGFKRGLIYCPTIATQSPGTLSRWWLFSFFKKRQIKFIAFYSYFVFFLKLTPLSPARGTRHRRLRSNCRSKHIMYLLNSFRLQELVNLKRRIGPARGPRHRRLRSNRRSKHINKQIQNIWLFVFFQRFLAF